MAQAKPAAASAKRAKKVVEAEGIAHITATFNNTLITITDMHGNAITWGSSGKAGFKGSKKSTPFAATVAAEQAAREAVNLGVKRVHVRVQGPGSGREPAIQALATPVSAAHAQRATSELRVLRPRGAGRGWTLRRRWLGGRAPLGGVGVASRIARLGSPAVANA